MSLGNIALVTAMYVAVGLALLVVLWPTEQTGQRFLARWGIAHPTREQGRTAAGYLRTRRLLYLVLFLITPPAVAALFRLGPDESADGGFRVLMPLVVALLVAESIAALRQVRGVRVAVLARRGWRDLLPVWALALLLGLAGLAAGLAVLGLAAQPWADRLAARMPPNSGGSRAELAGAPGWLVLGGVALCLVLVLGLVRLAVRRHAVADPQVDAVLRARTARVAVGVGLGWLAGSVAEANNRLGFLAAATYWPDPGPEPPGWLDVTRSLTQFLGVAALFVAVGGWLLVTTPPRRARYLQAAG